MHSDTSFQEHMHAVLTVAARRLAEPVTFAEFRAEMVGAVKFLFADAPGSPINDPDAGPAAREALATQLALQIWNSMPVAANRFRPRQQATPERNAPCPCGSGRKYKQCCGPFPLPDLQLDPTTLLGIVLGQQPKAALLALPLADLSPQALALVAEEWGRCGKTKDAISLLETLFKDLPRLDHRAEMAADTLLGLYLDTNKPRKKQQFIDQLKTAPDKTLAAAAWQRQTSVDFDAGKIDAAWQAFSQAQRLEPNHPALSHLEILLLISLGRHDEARARARFWSARLARDPDEDFSDLIGLINAMANGNPADVLAHEVQMNSPIGELISTIALWKAPASHYHLSADGRLEAQPALDKVERAWHDQVEPYLPEADGLDRLFDFLDQQPLCGQSFPIIDRLLVLLDDFAHALPQSPAVLQTQLFERANALRLVVLPSSASKTPCPAQDAQLPWGWPENRPLLRMINAYADTCGREQPEATLDALRWMVYTANPSDNLCAREPLLHRLIDAGLVAEALALAEHYPDDIAAMRYGTVLARFVAGQNDAAAAALLTARAEHPKLWKMLAAANPRPPRLRRGWMTRGGDDEAWYYREDQRELWVKTGALAWAASIKAGRGKKA